MLFCFILCARSCWEGYGSRCERYSGTPGTAVGWFHEFSFFKKKKKRKKKKGVWQTCDTFFLCMHLFVWILQKRKTVHILLASLQASAQDFTLGVQDFSLGFACVFPGSKVFTRGTQLVLRTLEATSIPASAARLNIFSDPVLVADVRSDLSWRAKLRVQQRLMGDAKIGFPISMIVTPPMVVESSCSLVFYCDASRHGLGAFMEGAPGTFGPMPRC